ncbi:MAG: HAMP domain-containing protein [Candidatus Omnitrophica bacterium]|nr:HAMP domain-containing protein [Candidatus Omnitrophota bacterium]
MRKNYLIKKRFQLKYTLMIVGMLLVVMVASGVGLYLGMWGSIIENFSKFKVSQNLETVRRITDYEQARYQKGDYRLERIFREAELLSEHERRSLHDALKSVNKSLLPKIVILFIVVFIGGIFISHKIAGPMFRIEQSAAAIRDGDLRVSFNIRRSDEMRDTASVLEEMVDSLQSDFKKIKASVSKIEAGLNTGKIQLNDKDAAQVQQAIKDIDSVLAKYKT